MTTDQLQYWQLQEQKRSNVAKETISQQEADTHLKQAEETIRHNMTDEQIRQMLADLEKEKFNLEHWKAKQENGRKWAEFGLDAFYTIFSKMPKDATEGFANWGKGMQGIKGMGFGS